MSYGAILSRAAQITWRHKVLWLFGLLASLGNRFQSNVDYDYLPPELQHWLGDFMTSPWVIPVLLFFLLLALAMVVLAALGRAALVDQVNWIEEGGTGTLAGGWQAARRYGWRVFWIGFLLGLPSLLLIMAGLMPLLLLTLPLVVDALRGVPVTPPTEDLLLGITFGCFLPACCLAVVLAVVLDLLRTLAERVCILEDYGIWESITGGWRLMRAQVGQVAVLWLILVLAGLLLVIAIIVVVVVVLVFPAILLDSLVSEIAPAIAVVAFLALGFLGWLLTVAIGAVFEPFFSCCWTLAYRQWRGGIQGAAEHDSATP